MKNVDLSIIIVNWNTCDLLRTCISSLKRHLKSSGFEIIVVDNGSTDGSAEMKEAVPIGWGISCCESTPIWIWDWNLRAFAVERWIPGLRHFQRPLVQWAYPMLKRLKSRDNYRTTIIAARKKVV